MRLLPRRSSLSIREYGRLQDKRQRLEEDVDELDSEGVINIPPATQTNVAVVTVINGYTVNGNDSPITAPVPGMATESESSSTSSEETTPTRTRSLTAPSLSFTESEEDDEEDETSTTAKPTDTSTSSEPKLDSPSTQRITAAVSPTLDEDESSTSTTRTRARLEKPTKTSTDTNLPTSKNKSDKAVSDDDEKGGGMKATTWIAIVGGIVGALLLLMAMSAYYRRWRRKQREAADIKFPKTDNESFVGRQTEPPDTPMSRYSVSSEKSDNGPDWSDAPLVPPIPPAYQSMTSVPAEGGSWSGQSHQRIPAEESVPWQPDIAVNRSESLAEVPAAVPRRQSRSQPIAIETSGDSRLFTRPVSEVVLQGTEQAGDQHYDYSHQYQPPNVRHNSYASSRYEYINEAPHNRDTMASMDFRYQ